MIVIIFQYFFPVKIVHIRFVLIFFTFIFQEKRDTFRTLQKYLTSEIGSNTPTRPMLESTVRALEAIVVKEKDLKEAFICSMLQHPSFSGSLIRLLTSALLRPNLEDLPAAEILAFVAENFLSEHNKKRMGVYKQSPLWRLLEDYLTKRRSKNASRKPWQTQSKSHQLQQRHLPVSTHIESIK